MKTEARDPVLLIMMLVVAWLAAQTVTLGLVLARLAVIEDRLEIPRARMSWRADRNEDIWASAQLLPIPNFAAELKP